MLQQKLMRRKLTRKLFNADSNNHYSYLRRAIFIALFLCPTFVFPQTSFDLLFEQMRKRFEMADKQFGLNQSSDVQTVWIDEKEGRKLKIIPQGESETPVEVQIENGMITMSGKIMKTEEVETESGTSRSSFLSQFSKKISIPEELDGDNPKFEQDKENKNIITVFFPFKVKQQKSKDVKELKGIPGKSI